jgi:hypothetical protein
MTYETYPVNLEKFDIDQDILNILNDFDGVFLAGGSVRSYFDESPIHDYDLFFVNEDARDKVVKFLKENFDLKFECPNGTFHSFKTVSHDIQCIFPRPFATLEEVIDSFDFTITQFATDGSKIVTNIESIRDMANKRLVIHKITYPGSTIKRLNKYLSYGFYASPILYRDIVRRISDHDENIIDEELVYID